MVTQAVKAAENSGDISGPITAPMTELWGLLEFVPDAMVVVDHLGLLRFVNRHAVDLFGYAKEELKDQPLTILLPERIRQIHGSHLQNYFGDPRRRFMGAGMDLSGRRKDGTEFPAQISLAPVKAGDGVLVIAAIRDITELKRAQASARGTEEQLRQAQKMEAVGRLAGGVAHGFNNVLSVILSCAELHLSSLQEDDPRREDVKEIMTAGWRAAGLTRQLLIFSRQQVLEPKVLDVNEILSSLNNMLRRTLGEDVEFLMLPARELGRVRADAGSIEQVVMNLVVNARDAMPTGGKLTVETANVALDDKFARIHLGVRAGRHVMIAVSDTGTGMDKATQSRIFEPFFTTKEAGKGTGLGLATAFGIVKQSGGTIWVYSEPGHGTVFKVYLPRVDDIPEGPRSISTIASVGGAETILLVEDEEQVRHVANAILIGSGCRVLQARSAVDAMRLFEEHLGPIHLLLSDVVMPQMSGPELANRLAGVRKEMRVLFMSGYTDDSAVRHGVLEGEVPYLQKPITPGTLTRKVREVLDAPSLPDHVADN